MRKLVISSKMSTDFCQILLIVNARQSGLKLSADDLSVLSTHDGNLWTAFTASVKKRQLACEHSVCICSQMSSSWLSNCGLWGLVWCCSCEDLCDVEPVDLPDMWVCRLWPVRGRPCVRPLQGDVAHVLHGAGQQPRVGLRRWQLCAQAGAEQSWRQTGGGQWTERRRAGGEDRRSQSGGWLLISPSVTLAALRYNIL